MRLSARSAPGRPRLLPIRERKCTATAPIPVASLREGEIGETVRLSGWCHRIRDHGGVLFIDLRDHYGMTQCVADPDSPAFETAETLRSEWVVRVDGQGARNARRAPRIPKCRPAQVEVYVTEIEVLGPAAELPLPVFGDQEYPEETRLEYRFLDLRREQAARRTSCCAGRSSTASAGA